MPRSQGYTNSKTWEAWMDSLQVLWDNTELTLLFFILLSFVIALITWYHYPINPKGKDKKDKRITKDMNKNEGEYCSNSEPKGCPAFWNPKLWENNSSSNKRNSLNIAREVTRRRSSTAQLNDEDKKVEEQTVNEQLEAVFKLMQEQQDSLGTSIDDLKKQAMFYYR